MKLGIIGSYDEEHKAVCGQSDKTELFLLKFRERLGDENVCFTNMYNWKKAKYNKFLSIIYTFLVSKNIIKWYTCIIFICKTYENHNQKKNISYGSRWRKKFRNI